MFQSFKKSLRRLWILSICMNGMLVFIACYCYMLSVRVDTLSNQQESSKSAEIACHFATLINFKKEEATKLNAFIEKATELHEIADFLKLILSGEYHANHANYQSPKESGYILNGEQTK